MTTTPFLFVTDLDNTLVGDDQALEQLNQHLSEHRHRYGTKIVYATGRPCSSYRQLKNQTPLLEPDALIAAVGTEIYHPDSDTPDSAWSEILAAGWDRPAVEAIAASFETLTPQQDSEQRPFKLSYYLSQTAAAEVLPRLESLLLEGGWPVKLVYSGGKDLDLLPQCADKGLAVRFLRRSWAVEAERTVVCGDSGNDISMLGLEPERGIIVGNAQPELCRWHAANPSQNLYLANSSYAAGILEGLQYFYKIGNG